MAALEDQYRIRLDGLRTAVTARLVALYGSTIEPGELDASFTALFPQAEAVIRAGQSAGVSLSTAYLSALILRDGQRTAKLPILIELVGTSKAGTLAEGMAAWSALVKQRIALGYSIDEALEHGRYLVERFGDGEVTRVVDAQTDYATKQSKQFRGWRGIVAATACAECGVNKGEHSMKERMYRHGSCNCTKQYIVA